MATDTSIDLRTLTQKERNEIANLKCRLYGALLRKMRLGNCLSNKEIDLCAKLASTRDVQRFLDDCIKKELKGGT